MALFDSATAEMKRMRNQKKDGTALQQMQRSSARIEPTEWVFNPDGEFRKTRDIFDESTDSSPVSVSKLQSHLDDYPGHCKRGEISNLL